MPKVVLNPERQGVKDIDRALRTLKKVVERAGTLKDVLERNQGYVRPGLRRNKKHAAAVMRWKRELAKQALPKKMY